MIAPGPVAGAKAEAKQRIESRPIVENKTAVERKAKLRKVRIISGSLALIVVAAAVALMALPYFRNNPGTDVKATLRLEPFLVNLADSDEVRYVKTTFELGLAEDPGEDIKNGPAKAAIRDCIISLLSSKKAAQILTLEGKNALRQEIRSRVNSVTPEMKVLQVYIVDFVVQI